MTSDYNMTSLHHPTSKPWLSVIIPTYNGGKYLPATLDSIIAQNDLSVECIVIDDGSTDDTLLVLDHAKDKIPMQIYQFQRQGNWVANTNYALSVAQSDYMCFLHQDDIWLDNRLQVMKNLIEQFPEVAFFLHSSYYLDTNGDSLGLWRCPLPSYPNVTTSKAMIEKLLIQNFVSIPAPIFKRDIALRVDGLDERLWYSADWDFWLKIANYSDVIYYPKPLSGFRIHPESQTIVRSSYLQDFRRQLDIVYEKHLASWDVPEFKKRRINKIARFSIEVNSALAGFVHERTLAYLRLATSFILLGPLKAYLYIKVSRIIERVSARLKAQLAMKQKR
jgi:glycosyltransferase involved in cell wall biosynthesis